MSEIKQNQLYDLTTPSSAVTVTSISAGNNVTVSSDSLGNYTVEAGAAAYSSYSDQAFWQAGNFFYWDTGSNWWQYDFFNGGYSFLRTVGSWATSFRPSSARITFTSGTFSVYPAQMYVAFLDDSTSDEYGAEIGREDFTVSSSGQTIVVEVPLDFTGKTDIRTMLVEDSFGGQGSDGWHIDNIEFR